MNPRPPAFRTLVVPQAGVIAMLDHGPLNPVFQESPY